MGVQNFGGVTHYYRERRSGVASGTPERSRRNTLIPVSAKLHRERWLEFYVGRDWRWKTLRCV